MLSDFANTISEVGEIVGCADDGGLIVEFEGDDAFELGRVCETLRNELRALDADVEVTEGLLVQEPI